MDLKWEKELHQASDHSKGMLMLRLIHALTVRARDPLFCQEEPNFETLQKCNEFIHTLANAALAHLGQEPHEYKTKTLIHYVNDPFIHRSDTQTYIANHFKRYA